MQKVNVTETFSLNMNIAKKTQLKELGEKPIHAIYASISDLGILFACSFHNLPVQCHIFYRIDYSTI